MVAAPRRQRPHFIFATLLLLAGLLLLGLQLGVIPGDVWIRLLPFWPVLLVLLGVELLVAGLMPAVAARVVALVIVVAVAAGTVAFALTLPVSTPYSSRTSSAPVAGATSASLDVALAGGTVDVSTRDLGDTLYQATYRLPSGAHVNSSSGSLRLDSGSWPFMGGPSQVELVLNSSLPWTLNVSGAGIDGHADLSGGAVSGVNLSGAGSKLDVTLPVPERRVSVQASGLGTTMRIHLSGAPARATSSGLGSTFKVDGQGMGASWQTASYPGSGGYYELEVSGLGSTLELFTT